MNVSQGIRGLHLFGAVSIAVAVATAACGGGSHDNSFTPAPAGDDAGSTASDSGAAGDDGGDGGSLIGNTPALQSISITPASASITSNNGKAAKQPFTVVAHFADGSTGTLGNGITWQADAPLVGAVSTTGVFTANGSLGGVVHVSANYKSHKADATLNVKLLLQKNPGNVPPGVQTSLQGASTPDAAITWAYPYDGTVWPRGLLPPILQWNGGAATDAYYVHVVGPTFELQEYDTATNAPSSRIALDSTSWDQYTNSSAGPTKITVSRWDGTTASVVTSQTWTIAPASMRGTIYYWSNNLGRVLRIKPGAAMPDDFANVPPLNDPTKYPQGGCLMTCHTVSADGSTIVSGGGVFGGSFDLKTNAPIYDLGFGWGTSAQSWQNIQWLASAVSPTGKYVAVNAQSDQLAPGAGGPSNLSGMFTTANGQRVSNSGIDGMNLYTPAWSPPGDALAYVTADDSPWGNAGNGDLHAMHFDETKTPMVSDDQLIVSAASNPSMPNVSWPTFTPDGKWILFQRGASSTTWQGHNADLAFVENKPGATETPLDALDGTTYPFAAGDRDRHYNFEPAFAPVAAGGYFWVVFTSRRTYGNILTGDNTQVKQLWIAAIDQNPKAGADPSHAAFHLTGQDEANLAMRGYYALPPCAQNGQSCSSGTDCCGGYCAGGTDGGAPVCQSTPPSCSQDGDKCSTTSDCCGAASGVTCINHVCSEPTPQ